jgi:hypothetical protein
MELIRIMANKMESIRIMIHKLDFFDNITKVGRIIIYEFTTPFTGYEYKLSLAPLLAVALLPTLTVYSLVIIIAEALALASLLCVATWLIEEMPLNNVAGTAWLCCG